MRRVAGLLLTVGIVSTGVVAGPAEKAAANAACIVQHLTTQVVGASSYTYGLIEPTSPKAPCRLDVPSASNDISFLVVGGGGLANLSLDGAAGGGGAGGVGVHTVSTPPTASLDSFPFLLSVGSHRESTELDYTAGGSQVQFKAGEGGFGGQGGDSSNPGFSGGGGDAPGSGGGGGVGPSAGEAGGAAGGSGAHAHAGGAGFASGYTSNSNATGGGGGGAGGAGANGTGDATGGSGGQGVSFADIFPIPTAFATAANLPASIAEGGDGYAMGTTSTPSSPSYGSGATRFAAQGEAFGGSGVIIFRYVLTLVLDTSKGSDGLDPASIVDGADPVDFKVYLSGTAHVPSDPSSPKVSAIEWLDSQGQSLSPPASCGANDVITVANPTEEYALCTGSAMPSLSVGSYNIKVTMTDGRELVTTGAPFRVNPGMSITNISPSQLPNEGTQTITITGLNLPVSTHSTLAVNLIQQFVGQGGGPPGDPPGGPPGGGPGVLSASSQTLGVSSTYSDSGHSQSCVVDTSFAGPGIRCSFNASGFYLREVLVRLEESQGNATGYSVTFVPTISGVTPASGTAAGGESITISGTGLLNATSVDIGGVAGTIDTSASNTRTSLTVITNLSVTDGSKDVSLVVPAPTDQDLAATMTATSVGAFTYNFATALTPTFDTPVATADGFTVNVTNYDPAFTWGTPSVSTGAVTAGVASGSNLPLTVTGLSASVSATVTITNSRTGYNPGSGSVQGSSQTAAAPGTPSIVGVVPGDGEATITVGPGTGGAPDSYEVVAVEDTSKKCTVIAPSTSCTITGLNNGTSYTFTVVATNAGGSSSASVASPAVTPLVAAPGVPGIPTVSVGDGQATVTIVAAGSGGTPDSYTVTANPDGNTCTVTPPATSCVVSGLTNGTSYTFTATATNSSGTSSASSASSSVTPVLSAPGTPSIASVSAGDGDATVQISRGTGGLPASYDVTATPVGGGAAINHSCNSTTCVVPGLANGTAYTFTVEASNAAGTSATSSPSAQVTPAAGPPGSPTVASSATFGNAQLTVDITKGTGSNPVSYSLTATPVGGGTPVTDTCSFSASTTSCTITGLSNGVDYQISAVATDGTTPSTASALVTPTTSAPQAAPTITNAVAGQGSATLTISAAAVGAVSYTVVATPSTGTAVTQTCSASPCVITGLTAGVEYTFEAQADNGAGNSAASAPSAAVTPTSAPAPSTPNPSTPNPSTPGPGVPEPAPGATQQPAPAANTALLPATQPALALVGGQPSAVTVAPAAPGFCQQATGCRVPAGAVSNGTTASIGNAQVSVVGPAKAGSAAPSAPQLIPGQPLTLSASGLVPNSQAALFALPSGTLLGNISVGANGSLTGRPTLSKDLPADMVAIQLTANTADGPIALSIKVEIGAPAAPVLRPDGSLPQVAPGSSLVLLDGQLSTLTPRVDSNTVRVEVPGSSLALGVLEDDGFGSVGSEGNLVARPESWINLNGNGYVGHMDVFIFSQPMFLGRVGITSAAELAGSLQLPQGLAPGWHTIQTVGLNADGVEIASSFTIYVEGAPRFWTRAINDTQVKIYGVGLVGAGKVQFFQNGVEVAWVRAASAEDPKLLVVNSGSLAGRDYFVRTRTGVLGRNVFEIFVDGERVLRRIFTVRN